MVKLYITLLLFLFAIVEMAYTFTKEQPTFIEPSVQRSGNADSGYHYLITGDYLKSGLPLSIYKLINKADDNNYLNRTGDNATVGYGFNVVKSYNGEKVVVPTCLQCHADVFDNQLIVGLGNTVVDFSKPLNSVGAAGTTAMSILKKISAEKYEAAQSITTSFATIGAYMQTEVKGVNAADRLATLLVAHRNPQTLEWQNKPLLNIPNEVVPTDVPALWLLKKKNAMFYNGFGRGDFGKFLMLSNILTVKDTAEAAEVFSHFGDVLAYIKSIEAPKYPKKINPVLAEKGKQVFITNCSKCHGRYEDDISYPNLLIPASIIQTDSMLYKANHQNPQFIEWFNNSWFAKPPHAAKLVPANGYVAPPLDGVWLTAPYLHNGSVPTIEALLNSTLRPVYWERNFTNREYDFEKLGWKYTTVTQPKQGKTYNTTLKGYSNSGHTFGDKLTTTERNALIEYIKTL